MDNNQKILTTIRKFWQHPKTTSTTPTIRKFWNQIEHSDTKQKSMASRENRQQSETMKIFWQQPETSNNNSNSPTVRNKISQESENSLESESSDNNSNRNLSILISTTPTIRNFDENDKSQTNLSTIDNYQEILTRMDTKQNVSEYPDNIQKFLTTTRRNRKIRQQLHQQSEFPDNKTTRQQPETIRTLFAQ